MMTERASSGIGIARIYQAIDPRYFHLILFPTEKCSFRCTYCYEDFSIGKMSPNTVAGVKKLIESRTHDVQNFELSWFGGEPLLAKDIVFDVHEHVQSLGRNFSFTANMTTNGFHLDRDTASILCSYGVETYQISLDGQRQMHDQTRVGKGGFATFDRILANLVTLKTIRSPFKVILRLHFYPGNVSSVQALARNLVNEFADDGRFKIYFKNISHLGAQNDKQFTIFDYREHQSVKCDLESIVTDKDMLYDVGDAKYICYAARLNSYAIRADGRIAKCTVALGDDENNIGSLTSDGKMLLNNEKLKRWARGLESADQSQLQCPLFNANPGRS